MFKVNIVTSTIHTVKNIPLAVKNSIYSYMIGLSKKYQKQIE